MINRFVINDSSAPLRTVLCSEVEQVEGSACRDGRREVSAHCLVSGLLAADGDATAPHSHQTVGGSLPCSKGKFSLSFSI